VPAAAARAHPGLISARAEATLGDRAISVLAVVDDGQRRYSVPLELQETGGHWVVSAVGGGHRCCPSLARGPRGV
jgi:hypothetical protein